jgi:hypothetical protein
MNLLAMPKHEESQGPSSDNPEALANALELELVAKRAAWERERARRGTWRALSLLFLLLVILSTLLALFYFLPDLRSREGKTARPAKTENSR